MRLKICVLILIAKLLASSCYGRILSSSDTAETAAAVETDSAAIEIDSDSKQIEKRVAPGTYTTVAEFTECGNGYRLVIDKNVEIEVKKDYPADYSCQWVIVGEESCIPELTCSNLDIKKVDDDCSDEYLEVNDGVGGLERFCGSAKPEKPLKASKGMRDLIVKFKSSEKQGGKKGVKCTVSCSKNAAAAQELKQTFEPKIDSRCVCGLQNKDDRIVGGEDAKMNEFPWQVAIVNPGTRSPFCGGAIINDRYVLTAAHCFAFDKKKPSELEVLFHARSLDMTMLSGWKDVALGQKGSIQSAGYKDKQVTDAEEKTQRFKVLEIVNHPLFSEYFDYDAALLKLDRNIDLSHPDAPTPLCLPEKLGYNQWYDGAKPWVVGWGLGHEDAGGTTRRLQKLEVPVIKQELCQSWTSNNITVRMLCAGYEEGKKDACTGDSGGPLSFKKLNSQWEQIGIVSWGEGCAGLHKPGMYARVTELIQFIKYTTQNAIWCKPSKD